MTLPGTELAQLAIATAGGLERWEAAEQAVVRVRAGGPAFLLKQQRRAVADVVEVRLFVHGPQRVELTPFPRPGERGVFDAGAVRIEAGDGRVLAERTDARAAFRGLRHAVRWDALDALYFVGYALWTYLSTPFCFVRPGYELQELEPWTRGGETWRRLAVGFPGDVHTHSRQQVFYFDERGLLRRQDYTAEPLGRRAHAAHMCFEHRELGGITMPTRRRVYLRAGTRRVPFPAVIRVDFDDLRLESG